MNFVIAGYGRMDSWTARVLREKSHDVTAVDNNDRKVGRARDEGFEAVLGSSGIEIVLWEAGAEGVDAIGGLAGGSNINFTVCILGKEYDYWMVIRISEDYRQGIYEHHVGGVDEVIYPERLGAAGAGAALLGGNLNTIGGLTDQPRLTVVSVPDGTPVIGEHVANTDFGADGRVCAHDREREPMTISPPGTVVEPGDQFALLAKHNALDQVWSKLPG